MGPVQLGLPQLSALPASWHLIAIDIKDCFFSIPLHRRDTERFAFTLPALNNEKPNLRFEWTVLPQGMANSPTLCQLYVDQALLPFRKNFPKIRCLHYMDDILIAGKSKELVEEAYAALINNLRQKGLSIAPEKVQMGQMVEYLGSRITDTTILPQRLESRKDQLQTLSDFQKLLGDINWVKGYLKIANYELKPLYALLQGDSALGSPRTLTLEARQALELVEKRLASAQVMRINLDKAFQLCILPTFSQPTGVLWQEGPLLWVHLKVSPAKSVDYFPSAVASVALLGIRQAVQCFGWFPSTIIIPYTPAQINVLCAALDDWAILRCTFQGTFDNHYPQHPLMTFFKEHPIVFPKITKNRPIPHAKNIFTDGSKTGCGVYLVEGQPPVQYQFQAGLPQITELHIACKVFENCPFPFNFISDSAYVVNALSILEAAGPLKPTSPAFVLFLKLQTLIRSRSAPFFPMHIRAHTNLPGPLSEGNALVDSLTRQVWIFQATAVEHAVKFHSQFHVNSKTLCRRFSIPRATARHIVMDCSRCVTYLPQVSLGINPRGLLPGKLWQMDVTHIPEFGSLKYIHVSVDTCSGVIHATAMSGERARNVISHCLEAWAAWDKPSSLKTDNGPAYTGQQFRSFCRQMDVHLLHAFPITHKAKA